MVDTSHRITQIRTQHVAVEVQRLGVVGGAQHHMAEAPVIGDEPVAVGTENTAVFQRDAWITCIEQRNPGGSSSADVFL